MIGLLKGAFLLGVARGMHTVHCVSVCIYIKAANTTFDTFDMTVRLLTLNLYSIEIFNTFYIFDMRVTLLTLEDLLINFTLLTPLIQKGIQLTQ